MATSFERLCPWCMSWRLASHQRRCAVRRIALALPPRRYTRRSTEDFCFRMMDLSRRKIIAFNVWTTFDADEQLRVPWLIYSAELQTELAQLRREQR